MAEHLIDLLKLCSVLGDKNRRLSGLIKKLHDNHSASTDIVLAHDQMRTLRNLQDEAATAEAGSDIQNICLGVFISICVLYSRATKTSSNHRSSNSVSGRFDEKEKEVHFLICKLRDDAIAHFGPGLGIGKRPMQQDTVFAIWDDVKGALQIAPSSRRQFFNPKLYDTVDRHLSRTLILFDRINSELNRKVLDALADAIIDGSIPRDMLVESAEQGLDFFGGIPTELSPLSGSRLGKVKGTSIA